MNTTKDQINDLLTRGVENIIPGKDEMVKLLESGKKLNIYLGIDPTATRIHLGHAVALRKLQAFVELGHNVTFLIGDFTALIGDTSDKESERPILTPEEIMQNFQTYKSQAEKILDFSKVSLRHNSEWLNKLNFGDIIKLTRHFSLNDFISRELIKKRLTEGKSVSLPEVLYPVMQGYDSYFLDTDIQIGGTDQTFNMQAGRTLLRDLNNKESFVLTLSFLIGTDGRKMSKSWGNAIWLIDSAEEIYGKVLSLKDDLIVQYFTLATSTDLGKIKEIESRLKAGENPMQLKRELAAVIITELCGADQVEKAREHFDKTIVEKTAGEDTPQLEVETAQMNIPDLLDLLTREKQIESKSEGRRLIEQGGIYLNDSRLTLTDQVQLVSGENLVRIGKRKYLKLLLK